MAEDLRLAGFKQVREEARTVNLQWPGTPQELWQHFYDVTVMFHPVFDGLASSECTQAIGEVIDGFRQHFDGKQANLTAHIIAASGNC